MTIERFDFESKDLAQSNIEEIGKLFPGVITEEIDENGLLKKSIDFDKLMAELRDDVVEKGKERYEFTWPGKRQAMAEANKPIRKTLRPVVEDSKDWDNTENLYIEGDNLEVLKLLQESYLGKVKMIYIDPPYNTGNDFVYNDSYEIDPEKYKEMSDEFNEENEKLLPNPESNGRFHSDWCSMIYPRLKLARNLLSDDGVIFISIDDNEQENLKKICDEIFGEYNFIATFIWQKTYSPKNNNKFVSEDHDFVICYGKNKDYLGYLNRLPRDEKSNSMYKFDDNDGKGPYRLSDLTIGSKMGYDITWNGKTYKEPATRGWSFSESRMYKLIEEGRIYLPEDENKRPGYKRYLSEVPGLISKTILPYTLVGHSQSSKQDLDKLIGINIFDYPKPVNLIRYFSYISTNEDSLILDFFSGSATTAHAVMALNAEDGGKRKYIMVQLPEETDKNSEAYKAGYKNICEIGKERIRRAGDKILADNKDKEGIEDLDTGFRVFRVDSTNMKDVYFTPDVYEQNFLLNLQSNIKEDRNDLDLLFACLLDWGLPIDRPYTVESVGSSNIHIYNHGDLVACFSENLSENIIKRIAKLKPLRAVFRDSSFGASEDKINVEEIFKVYSPETDIRVL